MRKIFLFVLLFTWFSGISQEKPNKKPLKINQDSLTWYGKKISRRAFEDSFRVLFFKACECTDSVKIKKKN